LTLGGWDEKDYSGEIVWFTGANHNWDQVMQGFSIDDTEIVPSTDMPAVIFETGYPYIGLSPDYYEKV